MMSLLFIVLGGLSTALLYVTHPFLSFWWLLPIWLGFYVALALLFIVVGFGYFLLLPEKDPSPRTKHITHRFIKWILNLVLPWIGIWIRPVDTEKLPQHPYLLVCNHRSAFDPICTAAVLKKENLVFVAKPTIFNIPVIGTAMRHLCFLPIDRENARNAVTTIKRAAELIKGVELSVGIYPEGTRNKGGDLLPFHAGSFKIAKLANCPVVVATIRYEKSRILPWVRQVHIRIVDVMDETFVSESGTAVLAERAEKAIREDLGL